MIFHKYEAEEKMGHITHPECLLELLTANQEAFVVLVVINNIAGWKSRRGQPLPLDRKHCSGRWTKKTSAKDDDDDNESTFSARKTYRSGYSQEGLQFYEKAVKFFKAVREHHLGVSGGSYYDSVLMYYFSKHNNSKKRKRLVDQPEEEMNAADYGDWEEPKDVWAKRSGGVPV